MMSWMVWWGCATAPQPDNNSNDAVRLSQPITCDSEPVEGFDRFTLADEARGFTHDIPDMRELADNEQARFGAGLAAGDIDGDGDFDLVAGRLAYPALVYLNDGTGHFSLGDELPPIEGTYISRLIGASVVMQVALVDMDGDSLPELLSAGFGFLAVHPNLGGSFGEPVLAFSEQRVLGLYLGLGVGDYDGDSDLDALVVSNLGVDFDCTGAKCEQDRWPDQLLENLGGLQFAHVDSLRSDGDAGSHAMVGVFTDRDHDGDADLFVPKDYWGDNAFWRGDGEGGWVDDDEEIGMDYPWSAMGLDALDLNGDDWLDYCVTDSGPMRCMLSLGEDTYVEGASSLGLIPDGRDELNETVGWSLWFSDLDNDSHWDAAYVGAPMGNQIGISVEDVPDAMFAGNPDGTFTDVSAVSGFDDVHDHYGMVQADFDGDGFLELVATGPGRPLQFYDNACNDNHWTALRFEGPGGNSEGWGARVVVEAGGRRWMRELLASPGPGHSPPQVHFGLGDIDTIDHIEVTWPGGFRASASDLPTNHVITLSAQ